MKKDKEKQLLSNKIIFDVTQNNIEKLGIKELTLEKRDFLITWSNGRQICIDFNLKKSSSISQNIKQIRKILEKEVKDKSIDYETIDNAIKDIEDQIIKRRDEIYSLNKTTTSESNSADNQSKSKFLEDVSILREQFEKSENPYKEWQQEVKEKYSKLYETTIKYYPFAWPVMQFLLTVKTILNIDNNKLPFLVLF